MQEDRQREVAAENFSLMHRLASIMKEERGGPVKKYAHLSVEYRESLRRKKQLLLEVSFRLGGVYTKWGIVFLSFLSLMRSFLCTNAVVQASK